MIHFSRNCVSKREHEIQISKLEVINLQLREELEEAANKVQSYYSDAMIKAKEKNTVLEEQNAALLKSNEELKQKLVDLEADRKALWFELEAKGLAPVKRKRGRPAKAKQA